MIWGVGTGRCGTHLLAKNLDGVHEPHPRIVADATKFWQEIHTGELLEKLRERMELDTPAIIDHKNSVVIPAILRVDPDAEFIWLIRDPADCVESSLRAKLYKRDQSDHWDGNRLAPREGFPKYFDALDKNIWRYYTINRTIEVELSWIARERWKFQKSEDLQDWDPPTKDDVYEVGERGQVERQLRRFYVEWCNLYG